MPCSTCGYNPSFSATSETSNKSSTRSFCSGCGFALHVSDRFCRRCGQLQNESSVNSSGGAADKFCRRCGSRLPDNSENSSSVARGLRSSVSVPSTQEAVNVSDTDRIPQPDFIQETSSVVKPIVPNALLITAMWILTAASWVFWLALEPVIGIGLDLGAVVLALLLIFFPTRADRINGWVKIASEAVFAIAAFVMSLTYR